MCLAIPGRVIETFQRGDLRMARVQFGGVVREACLEYVPTAGTGDYVLVHVGFALSTIDAEEAARTYRLLEELDQLSELSAPDLSAPPPPAPYPPAPQPAPHSPVRQTPERRS